MRAVAAAPSSMGTAPRPSSSRSPSRRPVRRSAARSAISAPYARASDARAASSPAPQPSPKSSRRCISRCTACADSSASSRCPSSHSVRPLITPRPCPAMKQTRTDRGQSIDGTWRCRVARSRATRAGCASPPTGQLPSCSVDLPVDARCAQPPCAPHSTQAHSPQPIAPCPHPTMRLRPGSAVTSPTISGRSALDSTPAVQPPAASRRAPQRTSSLADRTHRGGRYQRPRPLDGAGQSAGVVPHTGCVRPRPQASSCPHPSPTLAGTHADTPAPRGTACLHRTLHRSCKTRPHSSPRCAPPSPAGSSSVPGPRRRAPRGWSRESCPPDSGWAGAAPRLHRPAPPSSPSSPPAEALRPHRTACAPAVAKFQSVQLLAHSYSFYATPDS